MTVDELNVLSDYELLQLEDTLLLERERNTRLRVKHTGGRFILFVLSAIVWGLLFLILAKLLVNIREQLRGIVSFVLFFVTLGLSVIISQYIWKSMGVSGRFFCRNLLHYWPTVLYFAVGVLVFMKS